MLVMVLWPISEVYLLRIPAEHEYLPMHVFQTWQIIDPVDFYEMYY